MQSLAVSVLSSRSSNSEISEVHAATVHSSKPFFVQSYFSSTELLCYSGNYEAHSIRQLKVLSDRLCGISPKLVWEIVSSEICKIFGVPASTAYILTVMGEHCSTTRGMGHRVRGWRDYMGACKEEGLLSRRSKEEV